MTHPTKTKFEIACVKCGFHYFRRSPACPRCEDGILRQFDTSTKLLLQEANTAGQFGGIEQLLSQDD